MYKLLRHKVTGKKIALRTGKRLRFRTNIRALSKYSAYTGQAIYSLGLTLRPELGVGEGNNVFLNRFFTRLRQVIPTMRYLWVSELQRRGSQHWHVLLSVPKGALPNVKYDANAKRKYRVVADGSIVTQSMLYKYWGQGQMLCTESDMSRAQEKYLEKYLVKAMDEMGEGGRVQGSSQWGEYAYSDRLYAVYAEAVAHRPELLDMYRRRSGNTIVFGGRCVITGKFFGCWRIGVESEWAYLGVVPEVPVGYQVVG